VSRELKMVNKWDGFDPIDPKQPTPIKPLNGEVEPPRIGPTVVRFKAFGDDPLPQQPTAYDRDARNFAAFILVLALGFAFVFGMMVQALFHII
jgi:hypothetical protein